MSVKINLSDKSRRYKIDVFTLQDTFIATLQSYEDSYLGQIIKPSLEIKDDGTQTFTCEIPKFIKSQVPNTQIINPRWEDIKKGIIAKNTRILKISIDFQDGEKPKILPFIIDVITNKRDNNFSVYKEITANGLAFAELGKIGYKIELSSTVLEQDFKKDPDTVATIDYWLDKVFPNIKDEDGNVIKWLTPWSYEIRMDWRGYLEELSKLVIDGGIAGQYEGYDFYNSRDSSTLNKERGWPVIDAGDSGPLYSLRDSSKIYEDAYVADWKVANNILTPIYVNSFLEKARYVNCEKSNKYNITQAIAEAFEVYCTYEYECDASGYFKHNYYDELGNLWTGKKVVFFNRAIKTDSPIIINYQHNLQYIKRKTETSELYTKLYIEPVASETSDTGYITIADTTLNPLLDDFILNFDYLHSIGSVTDRQMEYIKQYEVDLHQLNSELLDVENKYNDLTIKLNNIKSKKTAAKNSAESARESLANYETLRDNEVTNTPIIKNKNNAYSVVMVLNPNYNVLQGTFRLNGINLSTIKGFTNNKYEQVLFEPNDLIIAKNPPAESNTYQNLWYITLDEYGFPATIFTSPSNPQLDGSNGAIIYFELEYCPKNKYIAICDKLEKTIQTEEVKIEEFNEQIENLESQLEEIEANRDQLLENKDDMNLKLERMLGPALREGYWPPDNYEDPGQGHNVILSANENTQDNTYFIFDKELFEDEPTEYYYKSIEDLQEGEAGKTYYNYIDLSNIYSQIKDVDNFNITLLHPSYEYTPPQNDAAAGNKYVIIDSVPYYFVLTEPIRQGTTITLYTDEEIPYLIYKQTRIETTKQKIDNAANWTNNFRELGTILNSRHIYNNAGFIFSFLETNEKVIPIALLNETDIDYTRYSSVRYSFNMEDEQRLGLSISENTNKFSIVYPRIFIDYRNVNYDSDNLSITYGDEPTKLIKFEDYQILLRDSKPYITLKITNNQGYKSILDERYNIIYQVSRANEMLYLDAKQIAKDNSKPRYSYEIKIANVPGELQSISLGQLIYINDYSIDCRKETGYISGIKYKLDSIQDDEIIVSNYKTKFEDLFSTISAQSEAMRKNQRAYNTAAQSFQPNGEIEQEVLQSTLDNNDLAFNFGRTSITIDDTGGILLTNQSMYTNGVYGQIALRGGGIFCSNSIDSEGDRIWSTGITPEGINASLISSGQLDTSNIRIFSGDKIAFQWNSEGLYAFKELQEQNNQVILSNTNYVCFNEDGLKYVNQGYVELELGWNGLGLYAQEGSLSLTGTGGLEIFDGTPNEKRDNILISLGKWIDSRNGNRYSYGLRLQKKSGNTYVPTLQTNNEGELWLSDVLHVGDNSNFIGISGLGTGPKTPRIWAGAEDPENAPFVVYQDGSMKSTKATEMQVQVLNGLDSMTLENKIISKYVEATVSTYTNNLEVDGIANINELQSGNIVINNGTLTFVNGANIAQMYFNGTSIVTKYL